MGVQEAVAHGMSLFIKIWACKRKRGLISWGELGLLKPYDIVQTAPGTLVAEFFFTSTFSLSLLVIHQKLTLIYSRSSPCWTSSLVPHPRLVHCVCFSPSRCCLTQLTLTIITVTRFHPLNRCKMKSSRTSLRSPCVRPRRRRRLLLLARRRPRRKRVRLLVGKGKDEMGLAAGGPKIVFPQQM